GEFFELGFRGLQSLLAHFQFGEGDGVAQAKKDISLFDAIAHVNRNVGDDVADGGADGDVLTEGLDDPRAGYVRGKGGLRWLNDRLRDRRWAIAGNDSLHGEENSDQGDKRQEEFSEHGIRAPWDY